jgi:hypothetical protein
MRTILRRCFTLFMTAWLLLSSVGFVWTKSTCLFTGISQTSWSVNKPIENKQQTQLKRSVCFQFKHFQVKHQSAFSMKKQFSYLAISPLQVRLVKVNNDKYDDLCFDKCIRTKSLYTDQSTRRAYLQVYLI